MGMPWFRGGRLGWRKWGMPRRTGWTCCCAAPCATRPSMNPSCRTVDCPFLVSGSNGDHLHSPSAGRLPPLPGRMCLLSWGPRTCRRFAAALEPLYRDGCQDGTHACFSCGWGNHAWWESLPIPHCRWSQLPHPNHLRLRLRSMLLRRCRSDSDSDSESDSDSDTMTSARDSSRSRHLRHALKGRRPWPSGLIPATNAQH